MALTAKELDAKANKERLSYAGMALEALRNVIKNNPGTHNFLEKTAVRVCYHI